MGTIYYVSSYKPIMCGIADYTHFIIRESPAGKWGVISFNLKNYGAPVLNNSIILERVWYGIPSRNDFSCAVISEGVRWLSPGHEDYVLWFQHEFGIWKDSQKFIKMLCELDEKKIVTFHSLHFQSEETWCGLQKREYNLLHDLLPYIDAITVFSRGVYNAVVKAFPQSREKVHLLRHGIHLYPEVIKMTKKEAREKVHNFLLYESRLEPEKKKSLEEQSIFLDPDIVIIGETGFIGASKGSEFIYLARELLQQMIPHKRVIAVYIGALRSEKERSYAQKLRKEHDGVNKFFLETWLPEDILPLAHKSFDFFFYWPQDCTQSGMLAHVLGTGTIIASRDLEGVGETLKEAGGVTSINLKQLVAELKELIQSPRLIQKRREKILEYAAKFSWRNQALSHYELADKVVRGRQNV